MRLTPAWCLQPISAPNRFGTHGGGLYLTAPLTGLPVQGESLLQQSDGLLVSALAHADVAEPAQDAGGAGLMSEAAVDSQRLFQGSGGLLQLPAAQGELADWPGLNHIGHVANSRTA
jgi:hypothetical protein